MFHIVDDKIFVREIIAEMLEGLGYASLSFSNPLEYIEYIKSASFEAPIATFTDINMPDMCGYEMMDAVFQRIEDYRFIIVTSEVEVRREYLDKVAGSLPKPFRIRDMMEVISPYLYTDQIILSHYGRQVIQKQAMYA